MIPIVTGLLPETMTQCRRIITDGGTIISQKWMDQVIRTLKAQGVYTSTKFLADANFAVKKDGSNAVSTLYDISGNNNDATQATGANQPIWTAAQQNGKAGLVFDGSKCLTAASSASLNLGTSAFTLYGIINFDNPLANLDAFLTKDSYPGSGTTYTGYFLNVQSAPVKSILQTRNVISGAGNNNVAYSADISGGAAMLLMGIRASSSPANLISYKNSTGGTPALEAGETNVDNSTDLVIGAINALSLAQYLNGKGMSFGIFSTALSTAQRQVLEGLLNSYYVIY